MQSLEATSTWTDAKPAKAQALIRRYLSHQQLHDRLVDLPQQFHHPQPRAWRRIDWQAIHCTQVVGLPLDIFLSAIAGAAAVETPIRGYASVSWRYLEMLHPQMATFVGGTFDQYGQLIEPGMWEKEERQHTPALTKIYAQLAGKKLVVQAKWVKAYQPTGNPREDLFRHGLHRMMTEYGATCLYLWLMTHTTGPLHQALAELLQDEINHMTKFWGFGLWMYPDSYLQRILESLRRCLLSGLSFIKPRDITQRSAHVRSTVELVHTFKQVMAGLNWSTWSLPHKVEVVYIFACVLMQMLGWSQSITRHELKQLFGAEVMSC
jgi:hypothetical protein